MITGNEIRAARLRVGEDQASFAKRFGVDQATISRWEAKGPKSGVAKKIIERVLEEIRPRRRRSQ